MGMPRGGRGVGVSPIDDVGFAAAEALEVPPQNYTRDNVTLKVNAVIFLR